MDNEIIREHDLFIKSEGWLATIDYEPIPKYIASNLIKNGRLRLPESVVKEVASNEQPIVTAFHNVDEFSVPVSGDNFILRTGIRNTFNEKWAVCQRIAIYVLGTKSAIIIPFAIPGCVSEIGVMLSDVYLGGKEHDLSGLGTELSEFRDIRLEVRNKQITVYADDTVLFTRAYNTSIGNIVGFRYRFLGAGEVSYLKVTDLEARDILIEDNFQLAKLSGTSKQ